MGQKGDRASKEPLAKRLYADGMTLVDISAQLDVSETTLRRWKQDTWMESENIDQWDQARQQKRGLAQDFRDMLEEQVRFMRDLRPQERDSKCWDSLVKCLSTVERWAEVERARIEACRPAEVEIDRPKLFLEILEWIARVLKDTDPEGLKVLAKNFDHLTIAFKAEHAQAA